jgi:bifunctional non-homologous end joining protein LigD
MAAGRDQTVEVDGRTIKLTNLDKILYPKTGTTKADVIAYYAQIGPTLLGHVYERPATRKRWPDGVGSDDPGAKPPIVFFNKDLAKETPEWVARHKIAHRDHDNYYPVINDLATLTWLAQLASLEIHVPQWRFGHNGQPRNPDRLVLDLDPGPGVSLADCAEIALACREILRDIGHDPIPVTSGSKGIHLYAPLDGSQSPDDATAVARELARALEADQPNRVISQMKRSERDGKVFIDWSQNNGNKTTVAPYSLRGRDHPYVAAPRTWAELESGGLHQLSYEEVLARIDDLGDPLSSMADPEATGVADRDRLTTYRSMRDARKTPEPVPSTPSRDDLEGFSFVIQEHHARRLHFDFRLQHNGVLVSWAVPKGPPTDTGSNHLAVQTEDHPLEYGSFEGTIPKGEYGGGEVSIWDAGTYELHKWREGKEVIVTLHGRPDGGLGAVRTYALIHTGDKNWLMHLMKPAPTAELSASVVAPTTTHADKSDGEVAFPEHIEPMLATLVEEEHFGSQDGWAFEMKWDGVRTIAYVAGGRVQLLSRKGRDDSAAYFDVVGDLAALDVTTAILDGEVVVTDSTGRPDFGLLQGRINLTRPADIERAAKTWPAQLMIFDLLELNGESMIKKTYDERRAALEALVQPRKGSRIQVPPIFDGDLHAAKAISEELRLEGIVAKRRSSVYLPGRRSQTWLKIKNKLMQEVVIGGWRPGQGRRDGGVGSLLMGVPTPDGLRYVGRVGSGFNDRMLDELQALLAPLDRKTTPLTEVPREDARDARWVTPSLVGEVSYSELTGPGRLRHPVWRGLRPDKSADEVVWEGLAGALDVTH